MEVFLTGVSKNSGGDAPKLAAARQLGKPVTKRAITQNVYRLRKELFDRGGRRVTTRDEAALQRDLEHKAEIEAGRYDCVLVLAVEQERNVPGADAPKHLGAAAWIAASPPSE